jgi:thymidylate synthase (FAD)
MSQSYDVAKQTYQLCLSKGMAKELARTVLPVATYTEFYWSINARSLMNFISLRNSQHAQYEIQQFAEAVELCFQKHMPITHSAFESNGRIAV